MSSSFEFYNLVNFSLNFDASNYAYCTAAGNYEFNINDSSGNYLNKIYVDFYNYELTYNVLGEIEYNIGGTSSCSHRFKYTQSIFSMYLDYGYTNYVYGYITNCTITLIFKN